MSEEHVRRDEARFFYLVIVQPYRCHFVPFITGFKLPLLIVFTLHNTNTRNNNFNGLRSIQAHNGIKADCLSILKKEGLEKVLRGDPWRCPAEPCNVNLSLPKRITGHNIFLFSCRRSNLYWRLSLFSASLQVYFLKIKFLMYKVQSRQINYLVKYQSNFRTLDIPLGDGAESIWF